MVKKGFFPEEGREKKEETRKGTREERREKSEERREGSRAG